MGEENWKRKINKILIKNVKSRETIKGGDETMDKSMKEIRGNNEGVSRLLKKPVNEERKYAIKNKKQNNIF